jgi:hypothetical protein
MNDDTRDTPTVAVLLQRIVELETELETLRASVPVHRPRAKTTDEEAKLLRALHNDWQQVLGYPDRVLTDSRRMFLLARVREGFNRDQFMHVWRVGKTDPFLQGKNDRGKKCKVPHG